MGIVSYAQNFEDVMLWRAVGSVPNGRYIDIGAQHPVADSVTKAFYEHGWRGIHVEPTTEYANLLRADRPDEIIVQAAVSDHPGVIRFYEVPGTGMSTARKDIAEEHRKNGRQVTESLVTTVTLDDLFALAPDDDIQWLKIDVEGFEREVLSGWRESPQRPWIVVIEATYPNTQIDTFEQWEPLVLEKGYAFVYHDGLNRYYLSHCHTELQTCFQFPPNVFDGFQPNSTASLLHLKGHLDHELAQLSAQKDDIQTQLSEARAALQSMQAEASSHDQALTSLAERTLSEARLEVESHLKELLERERAHAERLEAQQREARARETALAQDFDSRLATLRQEWQGETTQLEATIKVQQGQYERDRREAQEQLDAVREESVVALDAARAEAQKYLNELLQHERVYAEQLRGQQREAQAQQDQLRESYLTQLDALRCEQRAREDALKGEHQSREATLKQDFDARLTGLRQTSLGEKTKLEQTIESLRDQYERTRLEAQRKSDVLREESAQTIETAHAEAQAHLKELLGRERAHAERLEALQREAQTRQDQLRESYLAQLEALRSEHRTREDTLEGEHQAREATLEQGFDAWMTELRQAHQSERTQFEQAVNALRGQNAELDAVRARLEQKLAEHLTTARHLAAEIDALRKSWSWRLTQPLRWLVGREYPILQSSNLAAVECLPTILASEGVEADAPPHAAPAPAPAPTTAQQGRYFTQSLPMPHVNNPMRTDMTLHELLSLPGDAFVRGAYRNILGREADDDGLRHYLKQLAQGCGKASVLHDLAQSSEAKARLCHEDLAPLPEDGFLDAIYRRLLGRAPDSDGKRHYLNALKKHGDRQRIIRDIERSAEARVRNAQALEFKQDLDALLHEEERARQWTGWQARGRRLERRIGWLESSVVQIIEAVDSSARRIEDRLDAVDAELKRLIAEGQAVAPETRSFEGKKYGEGAFQEVEDATPNNMVVPPLGGSEAECYARERILSPENGILYYYVDHTVRCPVNTGMQRVTRQLARSLLELGRQVVFVKWHAQLNRLVLVNQAELGHLEQWGGPRLRADQIAEMGYPSTVESQPVVVEGTNIHDRNWLIVPEVTHINFHDRQLTLDVILAAERACLRTAFVFYDAIPLRRAELAGMASSHEAYMRQLLQADVIFPISEWSAQELHVFLQHHELVGEGYIPSIEPLLLPAEVYGEERVISNGADSDVGVRKILCVGSIDERKNQMALVRAFVKLARAGHAKNWQLGLIGNCNPGLHEELKILMESCSSVLWYGNSSDAKLKQAYADCAFTVFPSVEEGYGLPVAESLWYGKPCICANFGPMAEIAEGGGCLQINMRDQEAISKGLRSMMHDKRLRDELAQQAKRRKLSSWSDYGRSFLQRLTARSNPISDLGFVYYLVDHTASYPHNTGIQRVVRALAAALQRQGVRLIAAKWNEDKTGLVPPGPEELAHLAKWNGPQVNEWAAWREPDGLSHGDWAIFPELTPHYQPSEYVAIRNFLEARFMRGCWVFYDTIPWKLRDIYPVEATQGHCHYMAGLNLFELILPISHYSRDQLETFYLGEPQATVDLSHRLIACPLPGEFQETPRVLMTKEAHDQPIHILSVGTLEPRKNHLTLMRAFLRAVETSQRSMRLTLAGGGPVAEIADQVNALIAQNPNIEWIRNPSDTELNRLYAECDFTVYPSYEEGFGLPILESLWHARPCICMNTGAMAEVAAGGGCVLVDTTDEGELAAAIHRLANDDPQRQLLDDEAIRRPFRTWDDYANDFALRMAEERWLPPSIGERSQLASAMSADEMYGVMPNIAKRPLLSVCISTYNRAKWLSLSLAVLVREAAGLGDKVELLVCDNTSTDNTPEIVAPYVEQGAVRYQRNPENVGMLGNLRVTAQEARGQYVWILGDDDLLKPDVVRRVVDVLEANPDLAMVYLNYAYTREDSPEEIADLGQFFATATPVVKEGASFRGLVKDVAVMNENFFTAIYCVVFQRSHALLAYSQFTEGEPFSSLPTCVPTTNHVLHSMMELPAHWVADPLVVINLNVSWLRYAWRWILERFPEIFDVAVRYGAESTRVDIWRENHLPSIEHFLREIFVQIEVATTKGFDFAKLITSIKHTARYKAHRPALMALYSEAFKSGHPLARRTPNSIFLEN